MSYSAQPQKTTRSATLLPLLIGAIFIVFTLLLWHAVRLSKEANLRAMTSLQASYIQEEVYTHMQFNRYAILGVAKRWEAHGGFSRLDWVADTQNFMRYYPAFLALLRLDSHGVVHGQVSSKQFSQLSFFQHAGWSHDLLVSQEPNVVNFTDIFPFSKDHDGFLMYVPLQLEGKFDGYLVGVVDGHKFFGPIFANEIDRGYGISIYQNNKKRYQGGQPDAFLEEKWGVTLPLALNKQHWDVRIWPTKKILHQEEMYLPQLILGGGILLACLLVLAMFLLQLVRKHARLASRARQDLKKESDERQRAEEIKSHLEKALQQSQKLQAIGTLAGGIAHDFNNILYAIMGYAEMAREDIDRNSLLHKNLGKMIKAAERGKKLVASILSYSRRTQHQFEETDLVRVIDTCFELLLPVVPASIVLKKEINVKHAKVLGDYADLEQVIINVINNAVDAMLGHGTVNVRLDSVKASDLPLCDLGGLRADAYFHIQIQDNGSGMSADVLQRLFEPFFTTKEVGSGTGLGLSIAHSIVENHHGIIFAESQLGVGTTFHIYLPQFVQNERIASKERES